MHYYCLHHTPALERKSYLDNLFAKHNINIEWITGFLPDSLEVQQYKDIFSRHAANGTGKLNHAEISLLFKHALAIKKIKQSNCFGTIFEDDIQDVDFDLKSVILEFANIMKTESVDILWVGHSHNHGWRTEPTHKPSILCNEMTKTPRLTHCYILSPDAANRVYNDYIDFKQPADWQWSDIIHKFNLRSGWSYPYILQRTDTRSIPSLLRKSI